MAIAVDLRFGWERGKRAVPSSEHSDVVDCQADRQLDPGKTD